MKKNDIETLVNSLIPKLYSFAFAMIPDELQAEQMVIDAYAVFLVREKNFLKQFKYKGEKKEKLSMKRYMMASILVDLYHMGTKRFAQLKYVSRNNCSQYDSFFKLTSSQRAVLFLKETFKMPVGEIQDVLKMEKFQVIETLYNARNEIVSVNELVGDVQHV